MRPFFSYFGAKWRLVTQSVYEAPRYPLIVEPFAGAAGYSTHYYSHEVMLIEKNPVVSSVWEWLIQARASDIDLIPDELGHDVQIPRLDVPEAIKWLIALWAGSGRRSLVTRLSMVKPVMNMRERKNLLRIQCPQIRHWRIANESFERAPNCEATWFIDPPYEVEGRRYEHVPWGMERDRDGKRVQFGSRSIDYPALGRWVRGRRGQVIVTESTKATWLPFVSLNRRTGTQTTEAIWTKEAM